MYYIQPFIGAAVILGIGYAFSTNRRAINWQTVAWGLGLQVAFAFIVLKTTVGQAVFEFVGAVNRAVPTVAAATAALATFARFEDVLGCFGGEPKADTTGEAPPELLALLQQRKAAKQAKDWPAADAARQALDAAGWIIKDSKEGYQVLRK